MPLLKKKKPQAEESSAKPGMAIAYSMKRKGMSEGGNVLKGKQRIDQEKGVHQPVPTRENAGTDKKYSRSWPSISPRNAKAEHHKVLGEIRSMPSPKLPMADGGVALRGANQAIHLDEKRGYGNQKEMGVHAASYSRGNDSGASQAGELVRSAPYHKGKEKMASAKEHHQKKLSELKSMKGPHGNYAEGGMVDCPNCGYSHGGEVSNDTGEGVVADSLPNEFDDLVLDDSLEVEPSDEDGASELVKKAMKRRKGA